MSGRRPGPGPRAPARILFSLSGIAAECLETDSILAVARANGAFIPAACQSGTCGLCKVRKLRGEVRMRRSGGLTDRERAEGFVLACCSSPRGEVEVEA